jgi:hypothetical protein
MKIAAECEKLYPLHMDGAIHTKGLRAPRKRLVWSACMHAAPAPRARFRR